MGWTCSKAGDLGHRSLGYGGHIVWADLRGSRRSIVQWETLERTEPSCSALKGRGGWQSWPLSHALKHVLNKPWNATPQFPLHGAGIPHLSESTGQGAPKASRTTWARGVKGEDHPENVRAHSLSDI